MERYTKEALEKAMQIVSSAIGRCEKTQPKFAQGTTHHTLLRNRIKALYIARALIGAEDITDRYTTADLTEALRPISSIISKCEKAQSKFAGGTAQHTRFQGMIDAMYLSRSLVTENIPQSKTDV